MAAKKSIPKKSAAHADATETPPTARRTRSAGHSGGRGMEPRSQERAHQNSATRPPDRDELLACLSSRLALVETVSLALRTFEAEPTLGSICMALNEAVVLLTRAHEHVDHYLQRAQS